MSTFNIVEHKGTVHGLEYVVVVLSMGYRCGYVRIPEGHPLHGLSYDSAAPQVDMAELEGQPIGTLSLDILFDVHGSLTFSGEVDDGWWLGFDCAHFGDGRDFSLMSPNMRALYRRIGVSHDPVRSREYVIAECESLARQIVERYPLESTKSGEPKS